MLTPQQEKFLQYWEANREKEKKLLRQARRGLPLGLSFAAGILVCVFSGWYQRAMMEMSADVNPYFLITIILLLALSYAVVSQRQKWEMNEQSYLEILAKLRREQRANEGSNHLEKDQKVDLKLGKYIEKKDLLGDNE